MPNWTTFDEDTSTALHAKVPEQSIVQLDGHLALEHVLKRGETIVAMLPGGGLGEAALAVFRWNRVAAPAPIPTPRSANVRATGFLGLTDEAVFEEEEIQEKKSWWKRFWSE